MQKMATQIFIYSSVAFGIIGIVTFLLLPTDGNRANSILNTVLMKLLYTDIFIILPSFALSVAGKYLKDK